MHAFHFSKLRITYLFILLSALFLASCEPEADPKPVSVRPVIQSTNIPTAEVNAPYQLSIDASQTGDNITYEWRLNNEVVSTSPILLNTLTEPGTYVYILTATNSSNQSTSEVFTVKVVEEKIDVTPPVIQSTGAPAENVSAPYALYIDASQTGSDVDYIWSINNEVVSTTSTLIQTILDPGTYSYTLTVTNSNEQSDSENFTVVVASAVLDDDNDGVINSLDQCPLTTAVVVANGCSQYQLDIIESNKDDDQDGVINSADQCPNTVGVVVNYGCSQIQIDANAGNLDLDSDAVLNDADNCPNTAIGAQVDINGCSQFQLDIIEYNKDDDTDGIVNGLDQCANTVNSVVKDGCSQVQLDVIEYNKDDDADGSINGLDQCANTVNLVVKDGCSQAQLDVIESNKDDDMDGVLNGVDACPAVYAVTENGCPDEVDNRTGQEIYAEDCQGCHGDEQGINADFGGALTKFQCDTCTDEDTLTSTIELTMPKGNAADCDNACSNKVAKYVLAEFDGYGDNLTGQQLYEGMCETCHGDGEQETGFEQNQLIPATCTVCSDEQATIVKITNTMPFGKSASCDVECATKIREYMRSDFSGYEGIVDVPFKNLGANGELSFAFINNALSISWEPRTDTPDFWLLERLNETTQQWDALLYDSANTTSFIDTQNSVGMYRLYSITNSVASVPVYGQAAPMTLSADNGSIYGLADNFYFLNKQVSNNFTAEMTIHSKTRPAEYTKLGLMARESLDDDSVNISAHDNGDNGIEINTRATTGAKTTWIGGGAADFPMRFKLQRTGNNFVISVKEQDVDWVELVEYTANLSSDLFVGVAMASSYSEDPFIAEISAFTIDNQIISDFSETNVGVSTGSVEFASAIKTDTSKVSINPKVSEQDLTKINRFVFTNQLKDISNQTDLEFNLSQDDTSTGFERGLNTSALSIEKYLNAAEIYAQSIAPDLIATLDCELDDSLCINDFITKVANQYLRKTPSSEQIINLNNVFWIINDQLGMEAAVHGLIETLVLSPEFIYQFETDGANMPAGTLVPVTGLAMAYRLANTLWAGMPDEALISAALNGELSTPNQIKAQATRMVNDEKAKRGFNLFYRQWLTLDNLSTAEKAIDGVDFDALSPQMLDAMDHYMNSIVFDDQTPSTLEALYTAPLVANNNALATVTNISSNSENFTMQTTPVEFGDQRTGLLGQPAMLALLGHAQTTSIVHRGVFVSKQLMCANFGPPPENVPQLDSIDTQGKSAREVLDELTNVDGCVECHRLINPVGGTFEHFDTIGKARNTDDYGQLIDASSDIYSRVTGTVDGNYNGLKELNEYLYSLDSVRNCFVSKYLTYAIGHVPTAQERTSISWLVEQLENNNGNIKQMLIEATQTPVFLYKITKQVGEL